MSETRESKNEVEQFVLNTRLRTVNVPFSRIHHTTTCHQNTLYCFSGLRNVRNSEQRLGQCVRDCHQLHFRKTFPWKKMADKVNESPSERFLHVMWSRTKTKSLWIAGGLDHELKRLNDIWCIDNSTNGEWRLVTSKAPFNIFACSVIYHKYLDTTLFYGVKGFIKLDFPSPEVDLTIEGNGDKSLTWSTLEPIPSKYAYRTGHASEWMQKNQMLIFGGESWNTPNGIQQEPPSLFLDAITETTGWLNDSGPESYKKQKSKYDLKNRVVLNDLWVYNIVTMKWELLHPSTYASSEQNPNIPSPRAHHTSCVVKRNLYIYGGLTINNGVVSAVEDMDVVWCLDLYKISKRKESNEDFPFNYWTKIEIHADRFLPRSVVGFSLDLIARKDKAVAFIGFGGYDLEQQKAVNRMFTLIDSNYAHIDFYTQSKQQRSIDSGSIISQDEISDNLIDSPQDELDIYNGIKENISIIDNYSSSILSERENLADKHEDRRIQSLNQIGSRFQSTSEDKFSWPTLQPIQSMNPMKSISSEERFPMQSDPLPFDTWNHSSSYSLFSGESNVFRNKKTGSTTTPEEEDEKSTLSLPSNHLSTDRQSFMVMDRSERDEFLRREAELSLEIQELREKLVQQQQLYIQETQFRELEFQTRVRSANNMRFKLLASDAREMSTDLILQVKSDLESSLSVVNHFIDQGTLCVSCGRNRRSVVFFPCTHVKLCEACSEDSVRCPVCSTIIQSKYRVVL